MKGSIKRYCACKDSSGKSLGSACPDLASSKHGAWNYRERLATSTGERELRRRSFPTKGGAEAFGKDVHALVDLAGADDATRRRVGDMIFAKTKRNGPLPTVDDVRHRLGVGMALDAPAETVGEALDNWIKGKRDLKDSAVTAYAAHIRNFLTPMLGDIPRDKLTPDQIGSMFDTIEEWNAEIAAAKAESRRPYLPDDVRLRKKITGTATQHRIRATLRNAYNDFIRRPDMAVWWNPTQAVRLPPEQRDPARVWGPDEIGVFLDHAEQHRLYAMWRTIVLRGQRRGEAIGPRWDDAELDTDTPGVWVRHTILEWGGAIHFDTPKSAAGNRWCALDPDTAEAYRARRLAQKHERIAAGPAWQEHGLIFAREDGTPLSPEWVSREWKRLCVDAGLPVIKLHEGRHTAATWAMESGLDVKKVAAQLGHSTTRITQDLYQHVRKQVASADAAAVAARFSKGSAGGDGAQIHHLEGP